MPQLHELRAAYYIYSHMVPELATDDPAAKRLYAIITYSKASPVGRTTEEAIMCTAIGPGL